MVGIRSEKIVSNIGRVRIAPLVYINDIMSGSTSSIPKIFEDAQRTSVLAVSQIIFNYTHTRTQGILIAILFRAFGTSH